MKIGVMGLGFVGTATKEVLEKHHKLYCYDPKIARYNYINELRYAEIIFVCVGTPMQEDGSEDMSYIRSAIQSIKELGTNPIVCIKSTIPPGTCKELSDEFDLVIGNNPEFLREKYAIKDFLESDRLIIGGSKVAQNKIKEVYLPIFPYDKVNYVFLTSTESEMVKHVTNAFLASQVGFSNEIYNICHKLGINYENIKKAIHLDKRLGRHIDVPGPDGKLGFGGHCLPKDLNSLIHHSNKKGYKPELFEQLWRSNEKQRK